MEKTYKAPESSELYRKINALNLKPAFRAQALEAVANAERLVGTAIWLTGKLAQSGTIVPAGSIAVRNKLKHQ